MGLFKRLAGRPSTSAEAEEPPIEMPRKKSSFVVPSSEPVTEASLKVFRGLPVAIRHDPSMVSFQQEHERWKGKRKFNLSICVADTAGAIPNTPVDLARFYLLSIFHRIY